MTFKRKPFSAIIAGLVLTTGAAYLGNIYLDPDSSSATAQAAAADTGIEVDVATVAAESVAEWQQYSGRLEATDRVEVRPLVPGTIVAVHFKDGALVKQGDPLFSIDPRPYLAAVERAAAQVTSAQASAAYAQSEAARADRLMASNAIAKREYDEKRNAAHEAAANLKAARAALQSAQVDLTYTEIAAPISGRVSRAELTVGNVVSTGASAPMLTTLVSVSPIYASFNVDEQTYLRYLRQRDKQEIPVQLGLANEPGYSRSGTIASVDNQLDTGSGTIRVRATFDNADEALLPGLYARVRVGGAKPSPTVLIDDAAIGTDQAKKFVFVVDANSHVQYREITPGNMHEGRRIVLNGLAAGERIVVNGMQRVRAQDKVHARTTETAVAPASKPQA